MVLIMKRKTIIFITIFAMLLSLFSTNVLAAENTNLSGGQLLKQYVLEADAAFNEMVAPSNLKAQDKANVNAMYLQSYVDSNDKAKQTYGGRYIDNNGELHVLLTEGAQTDIVDDINKMTENCVITETCENSLDELMALKDYVSDLMTTERTNPTLNIITNDIMAVGIYEHLNKVVVKIRNCNDEKITLFKNLICDSDAIVFEDIEGFETKLDIYAGAYIEIGSSPYTANGYSVGFRCKKLNSLGEYVIGFMTAGHDNIVGQNVYSGIAVIGSVMERSYGNTGNVDCAFVGITNENYTPVNILRGRQGTLVDGIFITEYSIGDTVYMMGATTNGTSGTITSTSMDTYIEEDRITIKDTVEATYRCEAGDSGGVVYKNIANTNCVTGINFAGAETNNGYLSSFSKVNNIVNVFRVTLY